MKPLLEQIGLGDKQSITAFRYVKDDFITPWHFHPQHELTYIESSKGTKFVGDYIGSYSEGELVLIKSYLPHCWKNYKDKECSSISTVVQWNKGLVPNSPEMDKTHRMMETSSKGIIYHKEEILPILPSIVELPKLSGSFLLVRLLDILVQLSHCGFDTLSEISFSSNTSSTYEKRMAIIHEYVSEHYHQKIRLVEVANMVSMSEQSFSRFFKKMMGRPFFKFLGEFRVNMASRMLVDTDWPISHIGYNCGYDSIPFFYKQFKQLKGCSPMKFRSEHPK